MRNKKNYYINLTLVSIYDCHSGSKFLKRVKQVFSRLYFPWSFSIIGFAFLFPLSTFANNQNDSDNVGKSSHQRNCHGLVVDFKQQPVSKVVVRLFSEKGIELDRTQTDDQGQFIFFNIRSFLQTLKLSHPDFEDVAKDSCRPDNFHLFFVLYPRSVDHSVTVTATRTPHTKRDVPSAVVVLTEKNLSNSPSLTIDDTLRQSPVFSLFRRTSSLVSHPTTQGVSLRGIGPSGVSRTLVLWDGVPLNDPFGGWVYWNQLDKKSIERIEIAAGGNSSLYGSSALGGVIQAFSKIPEKTKIEVDVYGGSLCTAGTDLLGALELGQWTGVFSGSFLKTNGYFVISPRDRGLVDIPAHSSRNVLRSTFFYQPSQQSTLITRLDYFVEDRGNGTSLRKNDTNIVRIRGSYRYEDAKGQEWKIQAHGLTEEFDSSFTTVSSNRQLEFLVKEQQVPVQSAGSSLQWTGSLGSQHLLTSGSDWRWVRGNSEELGYWSGRPVRSQIVGGNQQLAGFYLQDLVSINQRLHLQLGARLDVWSNHDAHRNEISLTTGTASNLSFASRGGSTVSPRTGASFYFNDELTFRGSFYRSFRAPTLNELYRGFRVGKVVTIANEKLQPESLNGFEAGLDWDLGTKVSGQLTAFWNQLDQAVSNITIKTSPSIITRQRRNVGQIKARGLDANLSWQMNHSWNLNGAYLLADSTFGRFTENPFVESNRLPQVPRHRATGSISYQNNSFFDAFLLARFVGLQFDDDLNQHPMGNYMLLNLNLSRRLHPNVVVSFSVENLLNRNYLVSNTLVQGIGLPRMINTGLRFFW